MFGSNTRTLALKKNYFNWLKKGQYVHIVINGEGKLSFEVGYC